MAKITAFATTEYGKSNFKFVNSKLVAEQLREMKGQIKITIETIEGDATDAQIYHFRSVVLPTFIFEAAKVGTNYTERQAEKALVSMFSDCDNLDDLIENGKKDVSILIDKSKQLLREFFNIEL